MIKLKGITKVYRAGDVLVPALRGIDLHIQQNELLAIMGHSGSGKSTLIMDTLYRLLLRGCEAAEITYDHHCRALL